MATTIQPNPILLQQRQQQQQQQTEDEDVALATYLTNSLRFDQKSQQMNNNAYYYQQQQRHHNNSSNRPPRARISSNSSSQFQVSKSTSTPINNTTSHNITNTRSRKQQMSRPNNNKSTIPSKNISSASSVVSNCSSSTHDTKRRSSFHSAMTLNNERRPSVTGSVVSTTSAMSIQSDMSMNTKLSLSKRLRKVFSMNNLRSQSSTDLSSLSERNGSITSFSSSASAVTEPAPLSSQRQEPGMSFRRRSIASLSSLFQKSATASDTSGMKSSSPVTHPATNSLNKKDNRRHSSGDLRQLVKKEKRPELRVDTTENTQQQQQSGKRKGGLKARSTNNSSSGSVAPDSPNSAISSRSSFTRLPPPQQQSRNFLHHHHSDSGLPSPTLSTSSITTTEDFVKPIGLHYTGLGLHGSPKLRPASSSTSSLVNLEGTRRIQFNSTIQVHETFAAADYDRRCDTNATCQKLTPIMAMKIKQELNEYKLTDMEVHVESRQYTHFFL